MAVLDPTTPTGAPSFALDASARYAVGLMNRPTLLIPVPSMAVARPLVAGTGILAGIQLRESGTALTALTYLTASAANAAAANNVTLAAGGAGITTWVTGFEVTGAGATAGSVIAVTLTGLIGGTATYQVTIPAGVGTSINPLIVQFAAPGLPASGLNTAITLNVPSFGAGNTNAAASIHGYQQAIGSPLGPTLTAPVVTGDLLDGVDAGGELLLPLDLPPFGLINQGMGPHGPVFKRGLFFNLTAGTIRGAVWVKI